MAFRQQSSLLLFVCLTPVGVSTLAQTGGTVPTVDAIIARMAQARAENRTQFRPYTVTREYRLFGEVRDKTKSQVIVDVAFIPPDSKKYTIQRTSGSGLGGMVVRRMLANEAEVTKNYVSTDFSPENYGFRFIREEAVTAQRCYVLQLLPRRKDIHLLRGNLWVDASTYLPRRFEGELAKAPSWWVRDVRVMFVYSEVGGMWLQTALEASANLRILGHSTVVSQDVRYRLNENVLATSPSLNESSHPPIVVARH